MSAHSLKVLYAGKPLSNLISQVLLGKVTNGPLFQRAVLSFRILSLDFLTLMKDNSMSFISKIVRKLR